MAMLRRYLVAGLLVWLPLGATIFVANLLVSWMDNSLLLIPEAYQPKHLLGVNIPGIGILLSVLIVLLTGVVAANLVGRQILGFWERILARIPLVRSFYSAVKQLAETMLGDTGQSFRKVVLVEFPRRGLWTIGFLTGSLVGEAQRKTGREVFNVYIPTTPNPTGGYYIMVPKNDVRELDMSVDDGLKMILSMGAVVPDARRQPTVTGNESAIARLKSGA